MGEEKKEEKKGFFSRLKQGLAKTRDNIVAGIDAVFYGASEIDDDFYEELEEILIMGDLGVNATNDIIERMKEEVKKRHLRQPAECKELLVESIKEQMCVGETAYDFEKEQSVIFIIGVNGVGKTTSVGKLASILKAQGKKVLIAAADTFRAAAGDQLAQWAHRAGVDMIGGADGADPASVIYDAVNAAKARNVDILICDTAGRLHNKKNLMEELKKMNRIIDREFPNAHRENLIVLDGTTGQNALSQAREFGEVANLTGVILTKMDGTAKGGIAVAIQSELNVPVKYIGVGEKIDDLQKFDAEQFVNALFDVKPDENDADGSTANRSENSTQENGSSAAINLWSEDKTNEEMNTDNTVINSYPESESDRAANNDNTVINSRPESKSDEGTNSDNTVVNSNPDNEAEKTANNDSNVIASQPEENDNSSTNTWLEKGDNSITNTWPEEEIQEPEKPKKKKWFFW